MLTKNRLAIALFCLFLAAAGLALVIMLEQRYIIVDKITVEAGSQLPSASDFLKGKGSSDKISYITDISRISNNALGVYDIEIKAGRKKLRSKLEIRDTIPPRGITRQVDLYEGETAEAEQFFESIDDVSEVRVSFKEKPDFSRINSQPVILILTDASGNTAEYCANLRISKVKEAIKVEAGCEEINLFEFLKPGITADSIKLESGPVDTGKVGIIPVQLNVDGVIYDSAVVVVDTVPPVAVAENQTCWVTSRIEADSFITEIYDETDVSAQYLQEPDFNLPGDQTVTIVLTDEGGNQTTVQSILTVEEDTMPPRIYGAKKITAYIGQPVSYKKGVYAEDNKDGEVPITVDNSQVNLRVEGEYPVFYSAVDSSGNITVVEMTVAVKNQSVEPAELEKLADEVLAEITTEDMSILEKAWAIYKYVNTHVKYNDISDKTDWMKEAYSGITRGVGDCFTYYSVSHLLLNRIGIQTLSVQRANTPEEARHYWHMVNFGEGWYHFDACIHKPPLVSFMLTTDEIDAYSRRVGKNNYYYRYDRENYPESVKEPTEEILELRKRD